MKKDTILFLDIDGVFAMTDNPDLKMEQIGGIHCRPIPLANALLQAIESHPHIIPIWLTSWGENAHAWNDRSQTHHWVVVYPLSKEEEVIARIGFLGFPELYEHPIDNKLIAAQFGLWKSGSDGMRVIWMEDGFTSETIQWSKYRTGVDGHETILLDTTEEPIRSQLSSIYDDYDMMANEFIHQYLEG